MDTTSYKERAEQFSKQANLLKQKSGWLSFFRLLLFAVFIYLLYQSTQTGNALTIASAVIVFIAFLVVVKWYDRLQQKTAYYKALVKYNADEIAFLETNRSPYANGKAYEDPHHPYSYDLDLFGAGGLYAHLNRCSTSFGREALASLLLNPDTATILQRQEAVKELAALNDFRQQLYASGSLQENREKELNQLMAWVHASKTGISKPLYCFLMLFPLVTIGSLLYYLFISDSNEVFRIIYSTFVLNLVIAFAFGKKIAAQLTVSTSVNKILAAYKDQLRRIEDQPFNTPLLQAYQQQLKQDAPAASRQLHQLASLFEYLESIVNLVVSILLNGLFLFHVHILYRLGIWKKKHGDHIAGWLEVIGQFEALGSLGNFSFNNPVNAFPEISKEPALAATDLGHPLIRSEKRICNDVNFLQQKFIILTGSNMSGKSTFLRTVGMNLVLARSGAPVTASRFVFYPFDVYVSMRITDSLQESESFFYAELKRLQTIVQHLENGHITFVILDEILRGTNSNDKRNGTIGLIRKMAGFDTFGIIATHDVVVADLIQDYPGYISNKAFESEIINDELIFDYKLKDGVCTKLSASYLMKKMGVIDQ
ncbi:DNA mismatch repair protein MutS [Niabella pedocola]|uniref:DNA mismatch repair protein MutS n=1 Tax=Niabella pedocola TaxID=1752077 RepID=A0ABS8PRF1_9BACT|nr:DNA mismatch repair protein MutS [Niabella pedocola]MCD2423654.1 DNA mismatch repair protein MutS [Niabella pedocola]